MCLQKSNLCTAFSFFGVASPAYSMSLLWIAMTFPLFRAQRFAHSPAVYSLFLVVFSRCYLLSLSVHSAGLLRRPLLWGPPFPITTGVGPRQQRVLRCRSSSDPPARLCRGEAHSGASLALSPLLPGWFTRSLPFCYLLYSLLLYSLTPFASLCSSLSLRLRIFATLPPFSPGYFALLSY